jgi:hypothetical protein
LGRPPVPEDAAPISTPTRFSAIGSDAESWNALVGGYANATVSRREAMSVPAVKRARDVLCRLGSLPLKTINNAGEPIKRQLLIQPEKFCGYTRTYSLSMVVDDLLFYGRCLWRVSDRDYTGYPTAVERIARGRWTVDDVTGQVQVDGDKLDPLDAIVFTSPNDGLLTVGGGAIRALIALEATAQQRINQPAALEYFRSTSGADPDPEDVANFLADVASARKSNVSGWLPSDVERIPTEAVTPEALQLQSARDYSVLEVSRLTGLSPVWLGVPVSTRTYANAQDEKRDLIDFVASPYLATVEERLSLGDCTPGGQRVRFNLNGLLRANTLERYQAHAIGLSSGFLTINEVRDLENRPPLANGGESSGGNDEE